MSDRPVRLILDTSAITAYTSPTGSIDVGEVIAEIEDDHGGVGLPILCLISARRHADPGRLQILVQHPAAVLLATETDEWQDVATLYDGGIARLDAASAAQLAYALGVNVMTAVPGLYASIDNGDGPILAF